MKSVKPSIDSEAAQILLRDELQIDFHNLAEISDGQISRSYSLDINEKTFVLQFREQNMSQGCFNEQFFAEKFREMGIPVRSVLLEGDFAGHHFTLAAKVQGKGLDQLPLNEFVEVLPSVIDILLNIASIDTSDSTGYGWLDEHGNGMFASWRKHLCQIKDEEPGHFYGRWHGLFDSTFLDRKLFDNYYAEMERMIDLIPSRRELVHGGFGYGNVLVNDGQVSAVLDWADTRYGDHIFDLAWMINWLDGSTRKACMHAYKGTLIKHERFEANLEDRLKCYQYYIGIDGLRFAAKTENESFYRTMIEKLSSLKGIN